MDTTVDTSTSTDESDVTTGDDSITDTDDPGLSFYAGPAVDFNEVSQCDSFAQDCPEGEKCVPYGSNGGLWDANKCVPITGGGMAGDPCTYGGTVEASDDCDANSHCWNAQVVDGTSVGVCTPFCGGTPDDPICAEETSCLISNEGSITLCLDRCDPLAQDACPEGQACAWFSFDFMCSVPVDLGQQGEPCGAEPNDCAPGLACLPADEFTDCEGSSCCTSYCDVTAEPDLCVDLGLQCASFFESGTPPPGLENAGYCRAPLP